MTFSALWFFHRAVLASNFVKWTSHSIREYPYHPRANKIYNLIDDAVNGKGGYTPHHSKSCNLSSVSIDFIYGKSKKSDGLSLNHPGNIILLKVHSLSLKDDR